MRLKSSKHKSLAIATTAVVLLLIIGIRLGGHAESKTSQNEISAKADETTTQEKIERAMSAGPDNISKSARIIDTDAQGNKVVLREGSNGFTCMPGNPNVVGDPPICADAASMQWASEFSAHKPKPTNNVPGIAYMLAGATQRRFRPSRQDESSYYRGPALDDHVAIRSQSHGLTNPPPGYRRVHHVGRIPLCARARHGTPVESVNVKLTRKQFAILAR